MGKVDCHEFIVEQPKTLWTSLTAPSELSDRHFFPTEKVQRERPLRSEQRLGKREKRNKRCQDDAINTGLMKRSPKSCIV